VPLTTWLFLYRKVVARLLRRRPEGVTRCRQRFGDGAAHERIPLFLAMLEKSQGDAVSRAISDRTIIAGLYPRDASTAHAAEIRERSQQSERCKRAAANSARAFRRLAIVVDTGVRNRKAAHTCHSRGTRSGQGGTT
jgi:hypothetical protein